MVFVRKVMDLCFSKRELSWLDDLMPENKKKKLDDAEKEAKEEEVAPRPLQPGTWGLEWEREGRKEGGRAGVGVQTARQEPCGPH